MLRNNVRSRAWGAGIACRGGGTIDLEPCLSHTSAVEPTLAPVANALRQQRFVREVTIQYNLCNEPWIKYSISVVADKGLKKSLYTSARLKKGEVLYLETHSCRVRASQQEDTEKPSQSRPPHSSNGDSSDSSILIDTFRWSRCKKPLPQKLMQSIGIPLPPEHVEMVAENLDWEDVQWSQTGVVIAGKEYTLARVHFLSPS
ncbi:hypothetical protein LINPERPRIM_LOCUS39536 [Linum perenne]